MARRSGSGGRFQGTVLVLVILVVLAGVATWRYDLLDRWFPQDDAAAPADPTTVAPPAGLDLPPVTTPSPVITAPSPQATATAPPALDDAAVRTAVAKALADRHLGRHVRAVVAPLAGGAPAYSQGSGPATPASTTKLLTTTGALLALGPEHRFTTSVVRQGRRVVLVGGGDPYLASKPVDPTLTSVPPGADLTTLAHRTAKALKKDGVARVTVGYDDSLFSGPDVSPSWEPDYVPEEAVPVQALWADQGRLADGYSHASDPAATAAEDFAAALANEGVTVAGAPEAPEAMPARGATIASMDSAPLSQIVEHILQVSDNNGAEVLLRQTAIAAGRPGSFTAGVAARAAILARNGVAMTGGTRLYDGSGLSRHDVLDPAVLVGVLRLAAAPDHPELRAVITGLPVAGFSGSLTDRMDHGPHAGLGRVRAKTGTLTGVSSLAGVAVDLQGTPMVFVLMADKIPDDDDTLARVAQDDAAAALGACDCSVDAHPTLPGRRGGRHG